MRHTSLILTVGAILVLSFAALATAQMMGGMNGGSHNQAATMNNADSTAQSSQMGPGMTGSGRMGSGMTGSGMTGMGMMGMMNHMYNMMGSMSQNNTSMSNQFDQLEGQFQQMMQIKDTGKLKTEMQKYYQSMQSMHSNMTQQQGMFRNMMSFMHQGEAPGMASTGTNSVTNCVGQSACNH